MRWRLSSLIRIQRSPLPTTERSQSSQTSDRGRKMTPSVEAKTALLRRKIRIGQHNLDICHQVQRAQSQAWPYAQPRTARDTRFRHYRPTRSGAGTMPNARDIRPSIRLPHRIAGQGSIDIPLHQQLNHGWPVVHLRAACEAPRTTCRRSPCSQ